jgi:hypothetical protein
VAKCRENALGQPSFMHDEARFTRLAMVRLGGGGGAVRRYGLARLDDIALATPPVRFKRVEVEADDAEDDEDGTM